jgi:4-hydroxy 2-oxovalerate aldolase
MNIRLLDCTLRDGGHVNEGNFGRETIRSIINDLVDSNVDIIELGFLRDGSFTKEQALYNYIEEVYPLIPSNAGEQEFSLMIRPDWYDINKLSTCNGIIKNIRFAFYLKDIDLTEKYCLYAIEKGYRVFLNPVNIMGYSNDELYMLLERINQIDPFGVTIVDTFGALMKEDLIRIYNAYEEKLNKNITIGLHLHENMTLAFSLAQNFLEIKDKDREVVIDGSLLGMGRIPGNLCIEVIMDFMNGKFGSDYLLSPVIHAINDYIAPIKREIEWGYSPAYYFTAKLNMHRSYAEYLLKKKELSLQDIIRILELITDKHEKLFFDKKYAEEACAKYLKNY